MSSVNVLQNDYFADDTAQTPHLADEVARAYAAFALTFWRCRCVVQDLKVEVSSATLGTFEIPGDVAQLKLSMGGGLLDLVAPIALIDALLSRAPEPETLSQLSPDDAALILEHVLTPVLEPLEAVLGLNLSLHTIQRNTTASVTQWQAKLQVKAQGKKFPVGLNFDSLEIARAFSKQIEVLESLGPPIKVGYSLQIGPVFLSEEEISSLAVGDELMLGVSSFEGLSGLVEYDEKNCWPVKLVDGKIEFIDTLVPFESIVPNDGESLPLFYQLGVTAEEGPVEIGRKMPLARIEDKRMMIRHGKRDIAGAKLVKVSDGVALRITSLAGE